MQTIFFFLLESQEKEKGGNENLIIKRHWLFSLFIIKEKLNII